MAVLLQFAIQQHSRTGGVARSANQHSDDCEHLRPRVSLPGGCAWWRAAGVDRNGSLASTIIEGAAGTEGLMPPASASAAVPLSAASYLGSLLVDCPNCRQGSSRPTGGLFLPVPAIDSRNVPGLSHMLAGLLLRMRWLSLLRIKVVHLPMIARPGRPWPASIPPVLLAALALLLLLGLATPPDPRAIAARTGAAAHGDQTLFRAVAARIADGEVYYPTMRDELVARGYPTGSVVNWRDTFSSGTGRSCTDRTARAAAADSRARSRRHRPGLTQRLDRRLGRRDAVAERRRDLAVDG